MNTDTCDNDGNTTVSGGVTNTYDFENRMLTHGAVNMVYDGDGNRASETAGGVTTTYLVVDTLNPTVFIQRMNEFLERWQPKGSDNGTLDSFRVFIRPTPSCFQLCFSNYARDEL